MTKRFRHNLFVWVIYSIKVYIILIPFQLWVTGISISILIGFLFGMLNDITTELRKLNGEKFPNIEENKSDNKDELIKS